MTQHETGPHHSGEVKRPKGILKNASSYTTNVTPSQTSPTKELSTSFSPTLLSTPVIPDAVENKEITRQNTLQNAGRRTSSSSGRRGSARRQSSTGDQDENSPRLKWDEANLYLTEQERTATMKIDEPKTPFAPQYDPAEDEEELAAIDAQDLVVDELDSKKAGPARKKTREHDIPGLELGEPEEAVTTAHADNPRIFRERSLSHDSSKGEKHVSVGGNDEGSTDGQSDLLTAEEAREKHRQFEARRKRHYEMRDVKGLLGHPEDVDAMVEDEDDDEGDSVPRQPPPVPKVPKVFQNGEK